MQEQIKTDMEAMKEQMATMMKAMMSMKKIMEANAVAIAATSTIAKVNPMSPSGIKQMTKFFLFYFILFFIGCIAHCILSLKNKIK